MPYSSLALQVAVFNKLNTSLELQAQLGGPNKVFDWVPENAVPPYVVVGDDEAQPFDSITFDGADVTLTIHVWTRGQGRSKVKSIMDQIYQILHHNNLPMTGQYPILMEMSSQNGGDPEPDGVTYHGIQKFHSIIIGE